MTLRKKIRQSFRTDTDPRTNMYGAFLAITYRDMNKYVVTFILILSNLASANGYLNDPGITNEAGGVFAIGSVETPCWVTPPSSYSPGKTTWCSTFILGKTKTGNYRVLPLNGGIVSPASVRIVSSGACRDGLCVGYDWLKPKLTSRDSVRILAMYLNGDWEIMLHSDYLPQRVSGQALIDYLK